MDWRTLISNLVASLAWPVLSIAVILVMRRELVALLTTLRRVRWREFEAEFEAGLGKAREVAEAQTALSEPAASEGLSPTILSDEALAGRSTILTLAQLSPRLLVMESWLSVEQRAKELVYAHRNIVANHAGLVEGLEALVDCGLLPRIDYDQYSILSQLRDKAAHEIELAISADAALEYAVLARRLSERLPRQADN
ncbi:MAG TPA: hypothetical protein VFY36_04010 [Solirubrobacteraceae bacterium]|nr:hypothetical protein [Solirubrobacteraceae bacterium]